MKKMEVVMKSFRLTKKEMDGLADQFPTPFMVASLDKIEENYRFLRQHLPRASVFYAMKANPTEGILRRMAALGASFDVASDGEIRRLYDLGIPGERMIYANTVRSRGGLEMAARAGVGQYTFDDESEIGKLAHYIPGARVLVRIRVKNAKAMVDLNTKFGAAPEEALSLLHKAAAAGLQPIGICFHVGSQSLAAEAYEEALLLCRRLFDEAEQQGLKLTSLDIGGGIPVPSADGLDVDLAGMMAAINRQIERLFPTTEVWCEPGRYICGTAVNLVTTVIGTKQRGEERWYILDDGVYGALSGVIYDHWHYEMEYFKQGRCSSSTFAGPSCDGIDVVASQVAAPSLSVGDRILVPDCGAYSTASATTFNGFAIAPTVIIEEQPKEQKEAESAVI
jgi:ornithine decarboxylase